MTQLPNEKIISLISELWGNFRYCMLISSDIGVCELLEIINMKCQGAKPEVHNPKANRCEKPQTSHFWVVHICVNKTRKHDAVCSYSTLALM
jgi:hypothetical protein